MTNTTVPDLVDDDLDETREVTFSAGMWRVLDEIAVINKVHIDICLGALLAAAIAKAPESPQ